MNGNCYFIITGINYDNYCYQYNVAHFFIGFNYNHKCQVIPPLLVSDNNKCINYSLIYSLMTRRGVRYRSYWEEYFGWGWGVPG